MSNDNNNIKQTVEGNKNIQIGINNGDIITTQRIIKKTEVIHDKGLHISDSQAKQIKDKVTELAEITSVKKEDKRKFFASEYGALYNRFNITSYKLLPIDKFEEAMMFLQKRIAQNRPKLRTANNTKYRNDLYKSIYTRSRQIGMEKSDLLVFAEHVLELKKPITSLKELSDTRLKRLYQKVFNKRLK